MSKRNRRRYSDKPRQIITERRDLAREQEVLNTPMSAFRGTVVEKMLARLAEPSCGEVEALNIGIALQAFIRGDAALANNMNDPQVADQVQRLVAQRVKEDEVNQRFEQDEVGFLTEVFDRADKIRPVGGEKDRAIATGMNALQRARYNATARKAERRLRLEGRLANDPKVMVDVRPEYERRSVNGVVAEVQIKPVIKLMDKTFALTPGQQLLPKVIADAYEQRRRRIDENIARRNVLAQYGEANAVEAEMSKIDKTYGSSRDRAPIIYGV